MSTIDAITLWQDSSGCSGVGSQPKGTGFYPRKGRTIIQLLSKYYPAACSATATTSRVLNPGKQEKAAEVNE